MTPELCDWNPVSHTHATCGWDGSRYVHATGCMKPATVSVGVKPNFHLCESCAALPEFKRYRKRTVLRLAARI